MKKTSILSGFCLMGALALAQPALHAQKKPKDSPKTTKTTKTDKNPAPAPNPSPKPDKTDKTADTNKSGKPFYNIRVRLEDYPNDTLILGYRLGKQTYVKDTCIRKNSKDEFVFSKSDTLKGGIYIALLKPSNTYFEFLVPNEKDQQNMQIYTKVTPDGDLVKHLKIEGSDDNKVFTDYLHFLGNLRERSEKLTKARTDAGADSAKIKPIDKELNGVNEEVVSYQKNLIAKHPNYLSTKLIRATNQPQVPKDVEVKGQEAAYYYYKAHFFDEIDMGDGRLIRTPLLEEKIEFFLEKMLIQTPDSVIRGVEDLMQLTIKGKDKDMYQYVASLLLNKYAKSQVICMDAVYVHLGEKYYCGAGANKIDWVDKEQLEKICDNVQELKPLCCNKPALEIDLKNIQDSSRFKLSSLMGKTRFTVLFFWDPACGNCGKAAARLNPVYERFKPFGLEVVGICSKDWKEVGDCRKSATEKGMKWVNLSDDSYPLAVIKKTYAIKMNPYIYLYDQKMQLMYKRLDPEQVEDIVSRELKKMLDEKDGKQIFPQERAPLKKALDDLEVERKKAEEEKKKNPPKDEHKH